PAVPTSAISMEDSAFDTIDERQTLRPLLEALPERERAIVTMRFFQNMSQDQIAQELGISQMHVSRLLARTLVTLRAGMTED
ncbi:MAG: sigma-70 family RNA polymerase sigma factor, partial [Candidatus Nanopelagicales bacterium]|nr:sigma-70 family RNA polymerase sigma factor [Candidatus Nanopelagicales bacterium]